MKLKDVHNFVETFHLFRTRHLPCDGTSRMLSIPGPCRLCEFWADVLTDPDNADMIRASGIPEEEIREVLEQVI